MPKSDTFRQNGRALRCWNRLLVVLIAVDLAAGAALAFFPTPVADVGSFGDCTDPATGPDIRDAQKCDPLIGPCIDPRLVLGECRDFAATEGIDCPPPTPGRALSGKAIEFKAHGICEDSTNKMSTCRACKVYFCAKAQFWTAVGCPDAIPDCTLAVGQENDGQCDPT